MVLINGVKYACERCIRGHRVTTCTHTDQPLMMIKPKGRPSTQCPFCKEQRKTRNAHVNCNCSKKINGKAQHDSSCPCHVAGECTCCSKVKKKKSKDKDKEREKEQEKSNEKNPSPAAQGEESETNTPDSDCHTTATKKGMAKPKAKVNPKSKLNNTITNTANSGTPFSSGLETPSAIGSTNISPSFNNDSSPSIAKSQEYNFDPTNLDFGNILSQPLNLGQPNSSTQVNVSDSATNSKDFRFNTDRDSISSILQSSWDMSSPPMGNSESLASLLSDNLLVNNSQLNNANTNSRYQARQIGLDPLQNFRSSSSVSMSKRFQQEQQQQRHPQYLQQQQQRGTGEITIPMDEYIQPLNKMNVHFNNFLSTLSDTSPITSMTSPNDTGVNDVQSLTSQNQNQNQNRNQNQAQRDINFDTMMNNLNMNVPVDANNDMSNIGSLGLDMDINSVFNSADFMATNNVSAQPQTNTNQKNMFDIAPPTPGNGLLDIFENSSSFQKGYQNTRNVSPTAVTGNEPDFSFPLSPLIGPTYTQEKPNETDNGANGKLQNLSHSNLNKFNMRPVLNQSAPSKNLLQQAAVNQAQAASNSGGIGSQPFPKLYQNNTGSSSISSTSSYHSTHSSSFHGQHHNGSHGHLHQSHFQPYPTSNPRRSNSFRSISSANSVSSSIASPSSFAEQPQMLTAEDIDPIQQFTGPQVANVKTNTTLMDDIYQTKTYTDSQSIKSHRASMSNREGQGQVHDGAQLATTMTNNAGQNQNAFMDMSMIGSIPTTSSMFMMDSHDNKNTNPNTNANPNVKSNSNATDSTALDQYDEKLFASLLGNTTY